MGRLITAVALLIVSGTIFFLYTRPAYDATRDIQAEIARYDAALSRAAELDQVKQALLERYKAFNPDDVTRLQKLLPDHVDNVKLILDLDSIAAAHSLALQNLDVSAPSTGDNADTSASTIGPSRESFNSLTMHFTTQGTYEQFKSFMVDLEQSLRIVDLVELRLSPATSPDGQLYYSFDVTIKTYWLK